MSSVPLGGAMNVRGSGYDEAAAPRPVREAAQAAGDRERATRHVSSAQQDRQRADGR